VEAAGTPSQTDEGAASSAAPLLLESSASAATVPTPPAIVPPEAEPFDDRIDWLPVDSPVEGGEVLVFDPDRQGQLRQGDTLADPAVAGIALGPSRMRAYATGLEAPIAFSGLVFCMVDASYGAIRPGDLLSASPTPGHAMRSFDALAGTVVAKAAEALESGTGLIRVVVMPR
jgi:hypothetical protein